MYGNVPGEKIDNRSIFGEDVDKSFPLTFLGYLVFDQTVYLRLLPVSLSICRYFTSISAGKPVQYIIVGQVFRSPFCARRRSQ